MRNFIAFFMAMMNIVAYGPFLDVFFLCVCVCVCVFSGYFISFLRFLSYIFSLEYILSSLLHGQLIRKCDSL